MNFWNCIACFLHKRNSLALGRWLRTRNAFAAHKLRTRLAVKRSAPTESASVPPDCGPCEYEGLSSGHSDVLFVDHWPMKESYVVCRFWSSCSSSSSARALRALLYAKRRRLASTSGQLQHPSRRLATHPLSVRCYSRRWRTCLSLFVFVSGVESR